jgi:hypothetical protein
MHQLSGLKSLGLSRLQQDVVTVPADVIAAVVIIVVGGCYVIVPIPAVVVIVH